MTTIPAYKRPDLAQIAEANSRDTSWTVWAAILLVAERAQRTPEQVWEDPTGAEREQVLATLRHWAATGQIKANTRYWGEETIALA